MATATPPRFAPGSLCRGRRKLCAQGLHLCRRRLREVGAQFVHTGQARGRHAAQHRGHIPDGQQADAQRGAHGAQQPPVGAKDLLAVSGADVFRRPESAQDPRCRHGAGTPPASILWHAHAHASSPKAGCVARTAARRPSDHAGARWWRETHCWSSSTRGCPPAPPSRPAAGLRARPAPSRLRRSNTRRVCGAAPAKACDGAAGVQAGAQPWPGPAQLGPAD